MKERWNIRLHRQGGPKALRASFGKVNLPLSQASLLFRDAR